MVGHFGSILQPFANWVAAFWACNTVSKCPANCLVTLATFDLSTLLEDLFDLQGKTHPNSLRPKAAGNQKGVRNELGSLRKARIG